MVHVATDHDTGQVDIQPFEFLTEHVAFGVHKQRVDLATEQVNKISSIPDLHPKV